MRMSKKASLETCSDLMALSDGWFDADIIGRNLY